jgi:hypothetical protein
MEEIAPLTQEQTQEQAVVCTIHKMTFSEGRAYRYHIFDQAGGLLYVAEPTGLLLPSPKRLLEFFDPDHNLAARLEPPEIAPWLRATHYELFVGAEEVPCAVFEERWQLVDLLLLRLPRYELRMGDNRYLARGSRYGEYLYEIFLAPEEEEEIVEQIESPPFLADENVEQVSGPALAQSEEAEEPEAMEEEEPEGEEAVEDAEWPTDEALAEETELQVKVGHIQRPVIGPNYIIESDTAPLCEAVLVLAALTILIDLDLYA